MDNTRLLSNCNIAELYCNIAAFYTYNLSDSTNLAILIRLFQIRNSL